MKPNVSKLLQLCYKGKGEYVSKLLQAHCTEKCEKDDKIQNVKGAKDIQRAICRKREKKKEFLKS